MPATAKQKIQRKCFTLCAREWNDLPEACPPPPFCDGPSTRESVADAHAESGRMSSAYDYFMRCCMQLCDENGDITGDIDDCYPCPPEFDELIPDPGNQETFVDDEEFELCVTGGVPPYTWTLIDGDCVEMEESITACTTFQAGPDACCGVEALVEDSCGNSTMVGARGVNGLWVLTDIKTCPIDGPHDGVWTVIYGKWKVWENDQHWNPNQGVVRCPGKCAPVWSAFYANNCTEIFCLNNPDCDPVAGCDIATACVWDLRKDDVCTNLVQTESWAGLTQYCTEEYHNWCSSNTDRWCIQFRKVYEWRCS